MKYQQVWDHTPPVWDRRVCLSLKRAVSDLINIQMLAMAIAFRGDRMHQNLRLAALFICYTLSDTRSKSRSQPGFTCNLLSYRVDFFDILQSIFHLCQFAFLHVILNLFPLLLGQFSAYQTFAVIVVLVKSLLRWIWMKVLLHQLWNTMACDDAFCLHGNNSKDSENDSY